MGIALAIPLLLASCTQQDAVAPAGGAAALTVANAGSKYYVAPQDAGGNDMNSCTEAAPCLTMQRVSTLLGPGDTAQFAPGTYVWGAQTVTKSGTASARITYLSDPIWGATIASTSCTYIVGNTGQHVDIIGFDMTGDCAQNGLVQEGDSGRIISNRVRNLPMPDSANSFAGILVNCCAPYDKTYNQVIGNAVDNIAVGSSSNTIHGIYVAGPNSVIENNIVTNVAAACIQTYHGARRAIISNNTVSNCKYGIQISADPGVATNDSTTVANNIIVNAPNAIYESPFGSTGPNNVYYNNIVYRGSVTVTTGTQDSTITLTDAQFSALFVDYNGGDYHLQSESAAVDKGTTDCAQGVVNCVPQADFERFPRPYRTSWDIGAYEWHP